LVARFGDQKLEIENFWLLNSTSKFSIVKKMVDSILVDEIDVFRWTSM
jgi:hypothetical protein